MSASANLPAKGELLTPRNLILAALAIFALSILGMCWNMLQPNDSGGAGRDSFGTRRHGYRALFEILAESGVTVKRELAPPQATTGEQHTLALLGPDVRLVGDSPRFVQGLLRWVEEGGRLVVAVPPELSEEQRMPPTMFGPSDLTPPPDILHILGVADRIQQSETISGGSPTTPTGGALRQPGVRFSWPPVVDDSPPELLNAKADGSLAPLAGDVSTIAVPGDKFATLTGNATKLDGSLTVRDADGDDHLLVAAFARGDGQIIVIGEPKLLANALIAQADNSVLAARLLAPEGKDVVFDEFYHGLAVRGNPFYLLTRPGFAAVTLGILLGVCVWTWRQAVFLGPPLVQREPTRRDIREYINAMSDFFCRGPGHRNFLAREVRDGVLAQLCQELKLPPEKLDVAEITSLLARRDPKRAAALRSQFGEIDAVLQSNREYPAKSLLPAMHRLDMLSK